MKDIKEHTNIVIILIDTLRNDYSGFLKKYLLKIGFIPLENTISPAPWTPPSHASIFTGFYPLRHGIHVKRNKFSLSAFRLTHYLRKRTIPFILRRRYGYECYLFTANPYISQFYGYNSDIFDHIFEYDPIGLFNSKKLFKKILTRINPLIKYAYYKSINWPTEKGVTTFLKLLKEIKFSKPSFIFLNLMEVHPPYFIFDNYYRNLIINLKRSYLNKKYIKKWKIKYHEQVYYVSKRVLYLLKILREKKMFKNSLIIITSDHGQLLGEYNRMDHGTFLYDQLLRVPFLVKLPETIEKSIFKDYFKKVKVNIYKYLSLTKVKHLVLSIVERDTKNLFDRLYSDMVFAESHGVHVPIRKFSDPQEEKIFCFLNKYRIAMYYRDLKVIFNVNDWKIEKIFSYKQKVENIHNKELDVIKAYILNFIRRNTTTSVNLKI